MEKTGITLADIDYPLPAEAIAERPAETRDHARLCVLNHGKIEHRLFSDLPGFLKAGDCLVLNDTRVIRARLLGKRPTGGRVEVFLLEKITETDWTVMGSPGRALKEGQSVLFDRGIHAEVMAVDERDGKRTVRFSAPASEVLSLGAMPLPPYIRREADETDALRYQTVYAREDGSVAAPTAGLHFTETLLDEIRGRGAAVVFVTLHVGLGTFKPVTEQDVSRHKMEKERFEIGPETCEAVRKTKERGGRVFAAGTTTVRTLESAALKGLPLAPMAGETDLFIRPPFEFKIVDAMITNFHMPRSTLLLMVSAFAGLDDILRLYREALDREYRFLSYGDATLLLRRD